MTACIRVAIAAVLLLTPSALQAQETATAARVDHDVDVFVQDAADILTAPGSWDGRDWLNAGIVAAATAGAYILDEDVRTWSLGNQVQGRKDWLLVADVYGSGIVSGTAGVLTYAAGLAFEDDWTRVTGRMILQSLFYSGIINQVGKRLFGRARPFTDEGRGAFRFLRNDYAHKAFPSGHATAAFALSSTLARRLDCLPFSIFLYTLSTATALQRIDADRHWLSDTVLGAALGVFIGIAVVQMEEEREAAVSARLLPIAAGARGHVPLFRMAVGF